jgi:uncharacterized protein
MTIRQALLDSIEQRYRGRPMPQVAEVIKPPQGTEERVSPFTVVLLDGGSAGTCWNLLEDASRRAAYDAIDPGDHQGRDAFEVASELLAEDQARRIVGYAACSALSQELFLAGDLAVDTATDLLDLAGVVPADRVGLVGYSPPLLGQLVSRGAAVLVLEREGSMLSSDRAKLVRSPGDLAGCQVVLITSTTLLDDSLLQIERPTRGARFRAIYGPGAAIVPDALFQRGLDAIAGMLITDGRALADRQRRGLPWGDSKRKFVLRRA